MNELFTQLIAMIVSGFLFMNLSIKFGWSKKAWSILNKKIPAAYSSTVWIVFAAFLTIMIQAVCRYFGIADSKLITGIVIGFYFAFIPNLGKKNK